MLLLLVKMQLTGASEEEDSYPGACAGKADSQGNLLETLAFGKEETPSISSGSRTLCCSGISG